MVDDNFTEKGKDSIFMVFVETKASATAVSKYLTEKSSFARCEHLISSRSTSEDKEKQSQADQSRVIKRLLSKQINGVVATQVAEEGLNIPACNFVIRYNNTRNEISTVQVAGRSRAKQGTVTDFANAEKRRQEDINVIRLALMNDALSNILVKSDDDLQLEVRQRMRAITAAEAEYAQAKELHQQSKTTGKFTLRCGKCQETAVCSCDIRCYNGSQYVVIDKEFYTKITCHRNPKISKYDNLETKYKTFCKKCGHNWGVGACFKENVFCAIVKIKQFIITDSNTKEEYHCKTWAKLPRVQYMSEEEFSNLKGFDELTEYGRD
ncbi:probable ATP-dependent RNA helicase DHX58 [Pecten maximus]|uniref:probable ATP-dependent RNA helicase DHX58 n=1 Tax=Pecten maximus TaxID=6579 RepID=UPI001458FB8B|nr:probable ATP-dependent RNA helicase DHX58 [Pecten maximus]